MSGRRASLVVLMLLIGLIVTGVGLLVAPQPAAAQCSGDQQSACCACHAETHPVATEGEWHAEHVGRDCCWYCHGGNTQATDKDEAHVGVVLHPLEDAYLSCHGCHPDDYRERAAKFGVVLKVTPGSSEPVTQSVALAAPAALAEAEMTTQPVNGAASGADASTWGTLLLLVCAVGVGVLLGMRLRASRA